MSWSVSACFENKDAVRESLERQFASAANMYETSNPEEARDVRTARERALSGLEAFNLEHAGCDPKGRKYNAVSVSAYGSRGSSWMDLHVHIEGAVVETKPDAPPAPPAG